MLGCSEQKNKKEEKADKGDKERDKKELLELTKESERSLFTASKTELVGESADQSPCDDLWPVCAVYSRQRFGLAYISWIYMPGAFFAKILTFCSTV